MIHDAELLPLPEEAPPRSRKCSYRSAQQKGGRNERRSRDLLEAAGYRITRAAGSLGCWDLVGVGSTDFVLVQVKTRDWPGLVEMETLKEFTTPPNCRKLVHRWRDGKRQPDTKEVA